MVVIEKVVGKGETATAAAKVYNLLLTNKSKKYFFQQNKNKTIFHTYTENN